MWDVPKSQAFQLRGLFIKTKERTICPARISEFNKPELVTVTPLTNPNNIQDKSVNINTSLVKRAISEDTKGKGRGKKKEALVETPIILNLDGEAVLRFIQKRLLEFGGDNII